MSTASLSSPPVAQARRYTPLTLARWMFAVAALVTFIVAVGGITRLTESGLSITDWRPVTGTLPPLSEEQWQAEFEAYQQIGEYMHEAGPRGMTLDDYKFIYFWEWVHRLLGRVIGLALLVPMVFFWAKGAIPQGYKPRFVALFALVCLQGAFGWFMVRSGLNEEMTDVSHFWLSIHLLTALFTLGGLVWTARDLLVLHRNPGARPARLTGLTLAVLAVVFVQMLLGAWVAGLNAGHASNTWPLMSGQFLPQLSWDAGFLYTLTHDPFLLHWLHRWWAWVAVAALIVLARAVKRSGDRRASVYIHSAFGTMVLLGIATVMSGVALWLAVAHQVVGALLVASFAWGAHRLGQREVLAAPAPLRQ
ncbi:COX15/CtaA family protein [Alteraurantiacibacter palmitatis]|uniref:Heme A synthase n=1 Tax=Alteraurantiacibacter palmitatis TaxID=2054628 RepID=A0ABV7E3M2_9SPHN